MFHRKNRRLLFIILALTLTGIFMIGSASHVWAEFKYQDAYYYVKRQSLFAVLGLFVMAIVSRMNIKSLQRMSAGILFCCVLMLGLVLIPGLGVTRNGSQSWFGVGSFLLQPSEFAKLGLIVFVSDYLSKKKKLRSFFKDLLLPAFVTVLCFGLIMLQPDFGSGVVMCCSIVVLVIAAGCPMKYFVRLGMLGVVGMVALILSAPYRLARITAFLDPFQDPLGAGFQTIQALYAIGPGGIFGLGFSNSMQKHFYLPEPQTDFIFAIIAEELGFFGCLFIIFLFILLLNEGIRIALSCKDLFLSYVTIGIISLFTIQVMINLGVVVNLFPITGITLPFISYGGSSLVLMLASMGIVMAIHIHEEND